jgi:hypothetical protein
MLSEVILRSRRDWDAWIKTRENETPKAIWTIVNPDLEDDMADKPLPKPVCPTPASVKAKQMLRTFRNYLINRFRALINWITVIIGLTASGKNNKKSLQS